MGIILYRIFIFLYACGIEIASVFNPKARSWYKGRIKIFKKLQKAFKGNKAPVIWFHCASLGEFEQGRPLLEQLRQRHPDHKILLTFFSPSGYEIHKKYPKADAVFYLPLDGQYHARRFLNITKPKLVIFVKYEFWYFYLKAIHEKKIPLLLVSALFRKEQPFFRWYGSLYRKMLEFFSHIFVQDDASTELLAAIGIQRVTRCGDTRVDRVLEINQHWTPAPGMEAFCSDKKVLIAGSTWPEDDKELNHFVRTNPEMRFVIAPHEIDSERLAECLHIYSGSQLYSDYLQNGAKEGTYTLIIDNIGQLKRLYKYATLCFIGGGFGQNGIHNTLEAAVYEKPILFGPVYEHFMEAVGLEASGAAFPVNNVLELETVLQQLLTDDAFYQQACRSAALYMHNNAGATRAILNYIDQNLIP